MTYYDVSITDQAEKDLQMIYDYIAEELYSPDYASKQIIRLEKAIDSLTMFPEDHRLYEDDYWKMRNLRIYPVDNYCIFYIPNLVDLTVTVIRIIYSGRDVKKQLNKMRRI